MFGDWSTLIGIGVVALAGFVGLLWLAIQQRHMQRWLPSYLWPRLEEKAARREAARRVQSALSGTALAAGQPKGPTASALPLNAAEPVDVFLAICDHYEPRCYGASHETAIARVDRWCAEYPQLFSRFRDSSGRPPQHTFFFPQDEYHPEYLDRLAGLCADGWGDVDIHLHHDNDTADSLRERLESFRDTLFHRHGLLRRDPITGEITYGFIHGNWALCNCRPDGRWCGVDQELTVLRETGCYADFTLPSAPTDTQTRTINSIYYANDIPGQRKSHDAGLRARAGNASPRDHLLMIQGPLELDWSRRKLGLIPRIENADIHDGFAPSWRRMQLWLRSGVQVLGQPNWLFVKLHTHGCKDGNIDTLLGQPTVRFHEDFARAAAEHPNFRLHYVTAWEMAQLVHAAEQKLDWLSVLSPTESRKSKAAVSH